MTIKLAIADEDEKYVNRLVSVLEKYNDVNLIACTNVDSLESVMKSRKIDVLLFSSSMLDANLSFENTMAIMLVDDDEIIPSNCSEYKKINKYQRISKIHKNILEIFSQVGGNYANTYGYCNVSSVAFYSPIGGAGKTTLALTAASKLALKGKRTIYLNFEENASDDFYLPQSDSKGMSELAASIDANVNVSMKIQGLLLEKNDNLYYFNHFDSPNDLKDMDGEDIVKLLNEIIDSGLFDYIIVDLGTSYNDKTQAIFDRMDSIALVYKNDEIGSLKMNLFMSQAHIINAYGDKMYCVGNFINGQSHNDFGKINIVGNIPYVHGATSSKLVDLLANDSNVNFVNYLFNE